LESRVADRRKFRVVVGLEKLVAVACSRIREAEDGDDVEFEA
jgi:hypothetical protein